MAGNREEARLSQAVWAAEEKVLPCAGAQDGEEGIGASAYLAEGLTKTNHNHGRVGSVPERLEATKRADERGRPKRSLTQVALGQHGHEAGVGERRGGHPGRGRLGGGGESGMPKG